jgi:hypothetical protein
VKTLDGLALKRSEQALSRLTVPAPFDAAAAEARLASLLGAVA